MPVAILPARALHADHVGEESLALALHQRICQQLPAIGGRFLHRGWLGSGGWGRRLNRRLEVGECDGWGSRCGSRRCCFGRASGCRRLRLRWGCRRCFEGRRGLGCTVRDRLHGSDDLRLRGRAGWCARETRLVVCSASALPRSAEIACNYNCHPQGDDHCWQPQATRERPEARPRWAVAPSFVGSAVRSRCAAPGCAGGAPRQGLELRYGFVPRALQRGLALGAKLGARHRPSPTD